MKYMKYEISEIGNMKYLKFNIHEIKNLLNVKYKNFVKYRIFEK